MDHHVYVHITGDEADSKPVSLTYDDVEALAFTFTRQWKHVPEGMSAEEAELRRATVWSFVAEIRNLLASKAGLPDYDR